MRNNLLMVHQHGGIGVTCIRPIAKKKKTGRRNIAITDHESRRMQNWHQFEEHLGLHRRLESARTCNSSIQNLQTLKGYICLLLLLKRFLFMSTLSNSYLLKTSMLKIIRKGLKVNALC